MISLLGPHNEFMFEDMMLDLELDESPQFSRWRKHIVPFVDIAKDNHELWMVEGDGICRATMGQYFWSSIPAWSLVFMVTRTRTTGMNMRVNGLAELLEWCLARAERRGYYTYYSFSPARYHDAYMRKWAHYVPAFRNYECSVEEYIPAGTSSRFSMFWSLADERTYDEDFIVRRSSLKQEFRKPINKRLGHE